MSEILDKDHPIEEGSSEIELDADTAAKIRFSADGDPQELDMILEDAAADYLLEHSPEFKSNIRIVRSRTSTKESSIAARNRQRALLAATRKIIAKTVGLSEDLFTDENETAAQKIRDILRKEKDEDPEGFNPLRVLKIIQTDSDGKDRFRFPAEIMPKTTIEKWKSYTTAVAQHVRTSSMTQNGTRTKEDLIRADATRKIAHDLLSTELMNLLGVADFEEIRRVVSKMRDNNFPNIATGEEARVNKHLREGITYHQSIREHLFPEAIYIEGYHD